MTDAPKPPKRRKRKLIVAFVVLLSLVAWWYWPRGDARFVGKWKVVSPANPAASDVFEFKSNGTISIQSGPSVKQMVGQWRVNGERLALRPVFSKSSRPLIVLSAKIKQIIGAFTNIIFPEINAEYDILDVSDSYIQLRRSGLTDNGRPIMSTLTRIPE